MSLLSRIPFRRTPALPVQSSADQPYMALHREMDRLFESFFGDSAMGGDSNFGMITPRVDVSESEKTFEISAELPGVDPDHVDLSVSNGAVSIKGEMQHETENKNKNYYHMERSYGSFDRTIPLPDGVDEDSVDATFKNGVLHIRFERKPVSESGAKRIAVKSK